MAGPARRVGLYLGLVSDDPQPDNDYVRGALTWFQLKMMGVYLLTAVALWVSWAVAGRQSVLELAGFWSLLVLWMAWTGLRRARTPRSDLPDQDG
jgi:hypothetical protein